MTTYARGAQAVWAFEEHEHRDLARGLNRIHELACDVGHEPTPELAAHVSEVLGWLDSVLEPHIGWEEAWLYPAIEIRIGTTWATRAARFDHQQIRAMAHRLRADEELPAGQRPGDHQSDLRCHLFSLEALLRAHLEREERFLVPLLEETPGSSEPVAPTTAR